MRNSNHSDELDHKTVTNGCRQTWTFHYAITSFCSIYGKLDTQLWLTITIRAQAEGNAACFNVLPTLQLHTLVHCTLLLSMEPRFVIVDTPNEFSSFILLLAMRNEAIWIIVLLIKARRKKLEKVAVWSIDFNGQSHLSVVTFFREFIAVVALEIVLIASLSFSLSFTATIFFLL